MQSIYESTKKGCRRDGDYIHWFPHNPMIEIGEQAHILKEINEKQGM